MALERVPADIRRVRSCAIPCLLLLSGSNHDTSLSFCSFFQDGGVARMSDPKMIKEIKAAVTIPVMAKVRIGHFVEAQILEAIGIDFIDESEVLTAADDENHIDKTDFNVPFVCGCRNIGEALRRVAEGAPTDRCHNYAYAGMALGSAAVADSPCF